VADGPDDAVGIAFLPDGRMLCDRTGTRHVFQIMDIGKLTRITGTPKSARATGGG
jgi:hypothetical protein